MFDPARSPWTWFLIPFLLSGAATWRIYESKSRQLEKDNERLRAMLVGDLADRLEVEPRAGSKGSTNDL